MGDPTPAEGQQFDPGLVNVTWTNDGKTQKLGYVAAAEECSSYESAWYYDDPAKPTKVLACPSVCAAMQAADGEQKLDILFGCHTEAPVPK